MKTWLIPLLILLILIIIGAVVYIYGIPYVRNWQAQRSTASVPETEIPIEEEGLGEIPDSTEMEPEGEILLDEDGELVPTTGEATITEETGLETESPLEEDLGEVEPEDLTGAVGTRGIDEEPRRETRPSEGQASTRPGTQKTQPSETTVAESATEETPTSSSTTSVVTSETASTPTPGPAPGDYSVRTLEPVFKSQLTVVRKAMNALGVQLQEQKTGQQRLQAYRVAVGYFRTKAEADSWAQYNFRPRGIDYYVYPVQGMYSIQVGVYAKEQNVEPAMRELYRKYQGGRLPVRREITAITKPAYHLSLSHVTESLAKKVWNELIRLGIQAEIVRT
jgi:hypothetical protein